MIRAQKGAGGLNLLLLLALWLGCVLPVAAQQPNSPHIGYVYPAGGRQGTTFQVKVGGQFLDGATNAYVTGTGIRATVLDYTKPLTPQQANALVLGLGSMPFS